MSEDLLDPLPSAFSLARRVERCAAENLFGLRPGTIRPLDEVAEDSGSVPVRCEEWQHFPHVDMTHTETALHVDAGGPFIEDLEWPSVSPACVVTTVATTLKASGEHGPSNALPEDWVISSEQLSSLSLEECDALIVFAQPRDVDEIPPCPAYFTHEAMRLIAGRGIRHLLFSEFSVDRADDDGELHNHRLFWGLPLRDSLAPNGENSRRVSGGSANEAQKKELLRAEATITENIARPEGLADGTYTLVLNPIPAQADASPSAPLLLPRIEWD